jgi:hypothetical protein
MLHTNLCRTRPLLCVTILTWTEKTSVQKPAMVVIQRGWFVHDGSDTTRTPGRTWVGLDAFIRYTLIKHEDSGLGHSHSPSDKVSYNKHVNAQKHYQIFKDPRSILRCPALIIDAYQRCTAYAQGMSVIRLQVCKHFLEISWNFSATMWH